MLKKKEREREKEIFLFNQFESTINGKSQHSLQWKIKVLIYFSSKDF